MLLIIETITWKPHIETAIEIALREVEAGRSVAYCNMRRGLPLCEDRSPVHALFDLPRTRMERSRALIASRGIEYLEVAHGSSARREALAQARSLIAGCGSMDDVKALSYGSFFDIGWGVISSAASVLRDSTISPQTHRSLLARYLASSILVYERTRELVRERRPDAVMVFNGRFATTRAALRAAEDEGVPWKIHERGADKDHFWVADHLPHDLDRIQASIVERWREDQSEVAHDFYRARRDRIERDWHSFTKRQELGRLPEALRRPGEWVTFFTSSEDEMFAIGDRFESPVFRDQMEAIGALHAALSAVPGLRMCVRIHPHVALKARSDRAKWDSLGLADVEVVGPEDKCDSYALIERSRVVCTFGSTIGIEATYWGRPSLLFSRSYYDRLDVCEIVRDAGHIERFLRDPVTRPRAATLSYGAFWSSLGERYRYYAAEGLHRGKICGVNLDASLTMRAAQAIGRIVAPDRR